MTEHAPPLVSVVIPVRNEARHIRGCLEALAAQDYPLDRLEVLVVDGGSTDGTAELAAAFASCGFARFAVLTNPAGRTAEGRNAGTREARGEVIIQLIGHCRVAPDFVRESVAALRESGADCAGGPIESAGTGPVGGAIAAAVASPFGVGNAHFRYAREARYTDTVAFGAYRREVFRRIGLFDEAADRGEDDEFNYRLLSRGGRIYLTPRVRSTYYPRSSLRALFVQYFRYGRAKVYVARRHPGQVRWRHLVPPAFVLALVVPAAAGAAYRPALALTGLVGVAYLAASAVASIRTAARRGWRHLPLLPAAFACLHVAYGLGFLAGLPALLRRPARRAVEVSGLGGD